MLKKLVTIATHLDNMGLIKEADELDSIIRKIADEVIKLHEPSKPFDPSDFKFNFFRELDDIIKYIIDDIREATIIDNNGDIKPSETTIEKLSDLHEQLINAADGINLDELFDNYYNIWMDSIRSAVANITPIAKKNFISAYEKYKNYEENGNRLGAQDAIIEMDKQDRLQNISKILGFVADFVGGSILYLIESKEDMDKNRSHMEPAEA